MSKILRRLRQMVYRLRRDYFNMNNLVFFGGVVLCGVLALAAVGSMTRNWALEQKLEARRLDQEKTRLEIEKLRLEQVYYGTAEYLELAARDKQGKMLEGETMVVLPENSEAARDKYAYAETPPVVRESNFESWMSFLFPEE